MSSKTTDTPTSGGAKKTLSDGDIATYARRGGPGGGAPGTDADAHTDSDAVPTDQDTDAAPHTDAPTDKDT